MTLGEGCIHDPSFSSPNKKLKMDTIDQDHNSFSINPEYAKIHVKFTGIGKDKDQSYTMPFYIIAPYSEFIRRYMFDENGMNDNDDDNGMNLDANYEQLLQNEEVIQNNYIMEMDLTLSSKPIYIETMQIIEDFYRYYARYPMNPVKLPVPENKTIQDLLKLNHPGNEHQQFYCDFVETINRYFGDIPVYIETEDLDEDGDTIDIIDPNHPGIGHEIFVQYIMTANYLELKEFSRVLYLVIAICIKNGIEAVKGKECTQFDYRKANILLGLDPDDTISDEFIKNLLDKYPAIHETALEHCSG
jgi:hypothetical protein